MDRGFSVQLTHIKYFLSISENFNRTVVIAKFLAAHFMELSSIEAIKREESYDCGHQGIIDYQKELNIFNEKRLVRAIYNEHTKRAQSGRITDPEGCLGCLIDYEVPLKNEKEDFAGDIDLVGIDHNLCTINLIEVKVIPQSKAKASIEKKNGEPFLRALMELYTYYKVIEPKNFFKSISSRASTDLSQYKCQLIILSQSNSLSSKEMHQGYDHQPEIFNLAKMMARDVGHSILGCEFDLVQRDSGLNFELDSNKYIFFGEGIRAVEIRKVITIEADS